MARELRQFTATIPAGTPQASPVTVSLAMPARIVRRVRARIPPGPNGTLGWALASGGVNVIPWNAAAWIVGTDEVLAWDLDGQIESGAWELRGYNTGAFDHSVYLTFELDLPQLAPSSEAPVALIDWTGSGAGGSVFGSGSGEPPPEPPPAPPPEPPPAPPPEPPPAPPPGPAIDGYAIARTNATSAVQGATGGPVTVAAIAPPADGTPEALAYDAGKAAAIAALTAI